MRTINNNTQRRADAVWTIMPGPHTRWHRHNGAQWDLSHPNIGHTAHWAIKGVQGAISRAHAETNTGLGNIGVKSNWNFNGSNHRSQHPIVQFRPSIKKMKFPWISINLLVLKFKNDLFQRVNIFFLQIFPSHLASWRNYSKYCFASLPRNIWSTYLGIFPPLCLGSHSVRSQYWCGPEFNWSESPPHEPEWPRLSRKQ